MGFEIELASQEVLSQINKDIHLKKYVDFCLPIPRIFRGTGEIKLIIVGQDPTVKNPERRKTITQTLDLDKNGSIRRYLDNICRGLRLNLDSDLYATNFFKNFFTEPPIEIDKTENGRLDLFEEFAKYWLPLLKKEIEQIPSVPVITLGQPMLKPLLHTGQETEVRHYWGYSIDWQKGEKLEFKHIKPEANHLGRAIYPFPHQPSSVKDFYSHTMHDYSEFVRKESMGGV
jgi:hypothetical protein